MPGCSRPMAGQDCRGTAPWMRTIHMLRHHTIVIAPIGVPARVEALPLVAISPSIHPLVTLPLMCSSSINTAAHHPQPLSASLIPCYVRTRPTTPPDGWIRTALGELTPRNEHHHPAQHHISTNRNDGDDATRRLVLAAPCVWGIWVVQAADNYKADTVWCGGALRARWQRSCRAPHPL